MSLADTLLLNGHPVPIRTLHSPCHHLGPKRFYRDGSPKLAKETGCCPETPSDRRPIRFTPTYECDLFGKCAPFAAQIEDDANPTRPCLSCPKHTGNSPAELPTIQEQTRG